MGRKTSGMPTALLPSCSWARLPLLVAKTNARINTAAATPASLTVNGCHTDLQRRCLHGRDGWSVERCEPFVSGARFNVWFDDAIVIAIPGSEPSKTISAPAL